MSETSGTGLGAQYLEKMLQLTVSIPTLAAPEAETYLQLLLAELHLPDEHFSRVRERVESDRKQGTLAVHFNLGVAKEVLKPTCRFACSMIWLWLLTSRRC